MKLRGAALALALALAVSSISTVASADTPEDVVTVNDGTVWRGRITELVGGDHVTVQMPNGQEARIRWDAIVRLDRAGASLPPTLPPTTPPTSPVGGPPVRVHVEAEREVVLERVLPKGTPGVRFVPVCVAPCDREVPTGLQYRVSGAGVRSSGAFTLDGRPGEPVTLAVEHGTSAGFVGGIVLTSLGGATVIIGGALLLVGAITSTSSTGTRSSDRDAFQLAGAVTTGAGVAMFVPGLVLLTGNATTRVEQVRTPSREPTWSRPAAPTGTPSSLALPIAAGSF